jgi:hypothetical protein
MLVCFVYIGGIVGHHCLEVILFFILVELLTITVGSDSQQFNQYQIKNKQSPPNSDSQQFNQYQQSKQSPPNSDSQQFQLFRGDCLVC